MSSIRHRLLWLLLAALAVAWSAAAAVTYADAHRAVDGLLDAHLRQAARLLVAQAGHELEELHLEDDAADSYGTTVAFQVRRADGLVVLRSANAPATPFSAGSSGFSEARVGSRHWRVYSASDDEGETIIHVAEDHATRERIARRIALGALAPILVALPLLGLLIWLVVGRSLRPLDRLGDVIGSRGPDDLTPVGSGPLPAELRPLVQRLDELFLRIRDSLDSERRFTSHAAHELRTPVAALRAQAEVALTARDPAVQDSALRHCIEACDRMTRLVSQLLLLARADEADVLASSQPCRLDRIAQSVLAELAPEAAAQGCTVALESALEVTVRGDPALLQALVRNLADNAIRHGGRAVRVTLARAGDSHELRVEDDGPGVAEDVRVQLGRRFYRSPDARGAGSGLGLSIVARIATLHRAILRFEDAGPGHGLRVTVRFPG